MEGAMAVNDFTVKFKKLNKKTRSTYLRLNKPCCSHRILMVKNKKKKEDRKMNEEGAKKEFNYEYEKKNLKKKITIFLVITVAFTILFQLAMSENVSFFTNLAMGALFGIVFYIPGRIRDYFGLGIFMTIVIAIIFLFALIFVAGKIGPIAYIVLLLPIADMGYSIYKVVSYKKNSGEG